MGKGCPASAIALWLTLATLMAGCGGDDAGPTASEPDSPATEPEPADTTGSEYLAVRSGPRGMAEFVWIDSGSFVMGTPAEQEQALRNGDAWEEYFAPPVRGRILRPAPCLRVPPVEGAVGRWTR